MPALDFAKLRTYPVARRYSKVSTKLFAKPLRKGTSFKQFYDSLPEILAARDLRAIASAIVQAHRAHKTVLLMMGAHVIKCGLNPILIDLLERRVVTALAMNGAGIIHDFELAFAGQTSEEVEAALKDGSFGMAEETHRILNTAIVEGRRKQWGLGESIGRMINAKKLPHRKLSLLATCARLGVPATVHVAIGTDIIHQHVTCDGAALGEVSLRDFRRLAEVVSTLNSGVVGNLGSNVILPEVFLKAVSIGRNLGHAVQDFTAFDFDMIRHYRPRENVPRRPTLNGGRAYAITGHHELLIPLLARAVIEEL